MTKVKMLVNTRWNERPLFIGDEIEVDNLTAQRWAARKSPLCEIANQETTLISEVIPEVKKPDKKRNANSKQKLSEELTPN